MQDAHLGEGEGCSVLIPTPLPRWGRKENVSASAPAAKVPKILIYGSASARVGEGMASCLSAEPQHPLRGRRGEKGGPRRDPKRMRGPFSLQRRSAPLPPPLSSRLSSVPAPLLSQRW